MLAVFFTKLECFVKLILWKQSRAVEIVKSAIFIQPSTYIAVVLKSMAYHLVKLIARMTVLCGSVTYRYAFGRFGHRRDV